MIKRTITAMVLLCITSLATAQERQALKKWESRKYSMFIHWGAIYSTLGGMWEGEKVTRGYSEQIRAHHGGIYSDNYAAVAKRFNPERWNPDSIVLLAKTAGMKSVVITSKHHDGFCMFRSAYTTFNVVDATPYKRDVIKELADACKRQGLKMGLYFSLIDWNFPQAYPISSSNSDPITPEHHEYNKKQVTELLTNYGPISELWFDMGSLTPAQSNELAQLVHKLQPGCMVSGRLGNDAGDFCVMGDNAYPDYKIATPWQTPASVYDETWGYRSWQEHGKAEDKAKEKLAGLIKVVARGGNYLLNIGPRGDGSVVEFERDVLLRIGEWLKVNGDAIYNTTANPFDHIFDWGEVTAKDDVLYLHLLQLPQNGVIQLDGLKGPVQLTDAPGGFKVKATKDGTELLLPKDFSLNGEIKVLRLALGKGTQLLPGKPLPTGTRQLTRDNATKHYSISGGDYESYYRSTVGYSWLFKGHRSGKSTLWFTEQEKGKEVEFDVNGEKKTVTLDGKQEALQKTDATWGPIYLAGPHWGGITWTHEGLEKGTPGDKWKLQNEWKNGQSYELPSAPNDNWYVMQEVTVSKPGRYIVRITSGDGVQVFLNGKEQVVHNNPARATTQREDILLNLQAGRNSLVVKFYNKFATKTVLAIDTDAPQVLYKQEVSLGFSAKGINNCHMRLHQPASPHSDMRLSGLMIAL